MNRGAVHSRPVAFTESVSARVRDELDAQDVSFRELARRLGVSQPYVTRRLGEVVEDKVDLKLDEVEKIAHVLGVPVERFVTGAPTTPAGAA
jgi:transcriptional regulator with XRE-family HTH domain